MSENRIFVVSENEDEVNFLALCSLDYYTRTPDEFKRMFTEDRVIRDKDFHDLGSLRLNKYGVQFDFEENACKIIFFKDDVYYNLHVGTLEGKYYTIECLDDDALCVLQKEVSEDDEKVELRVTNIVNNDGVLCICLAVSDFSVNIMLDTNTYDFIDINASIGYHSYIGSDYFEPSEL
jgi:hypothetical protein